MDNYRTEINDLADKNTEIVNSMSKDWASWTKNIGVLDWGNLSR